MNIQNGQFEIFAVTSAVILCEGESFFQMLSLNGICKANCCEVISVCLCLCVFLLDSSNSLTTEGAVMKFTEFNTHCWITYYTDFQLDRLNQKRASDI